MSTPPPGLPEFPEDFPKRMLAFGTGIAAFMSMPIAVITALMLALRWHEMTPHTRTLTVLKLLPLAGIALACAWVSTTMRRGIEERKNRRIADARKAEARLLKRGAMQKHAQAVVGDAPSPAPAGAFPQAANVQSVRCSWCGDFVSVALADPSTGRGTCPSCGTTFSIRAQMQERAGNAPRPHDLEVTELGGRMTIAHFTTSRSSLGCMGIGLMLLIVGSSISHAVTAKSGFFAVLAVVGVGAVVYALYLWSARRTVYTIDKNSVHVEVMGVFGGEIGSWSRGSIDQVFLREREETHRHRHDDGDHSHTHKHVVRTWDIILREAGGSETVLAEAMQSLKWALYIEQEIENRLGVVDRAMGEGPSRRSA